RMQQIGPWILFASGWLSNVLLSRPVLSLMRTLLSFEPVQRLLTQEIRRFATGVTQVRLEA
ncbi:MAG TPA: hypothetical protein VKM54_25345, partial [Myxococcota bacterium]|nr:hypothetical protein [Myxococcota bacterium]